MKLGERIERGRGGIYHPSNEGSGPFFLPFNEGSHSLNGGNERGGLGGATSHPTCSSFYKCFFSFLVGKGGNMTPCPS